MNLCINIKYNITFTVIIKYSVFHEIKEIIQSNRILNIFGSVLIQPLIK